MASRPLLPKMRILLPFYKETKGNSFHSRGAFAPFHSDAYRVACLRTENKERYLVNRKGQPELLEPEVQHLKSSPCPPVCGANLIQTDWQEQGFVE